MQKPAINLSPAVMSKRLYKSAAALRVTSTRMAKRQKKYSRYETLVRDPRGSLEIQLHQLRYQPAGILAPLKPGQNALSKLRDEGENETAVRDG